MSKRLTAGVLVFVLLAGIANAFPRRVLVEEFTNTYCGPCATAYPAFHSFCEANADNIAVIAYHAWWPGSADIWYQRNISENTTRINLYGITGVPDSRFDGILTQYPGDANGCTSRMNTRLAVDSPVSISITAFGGDGSPITTNVSVASGATAVTGNYAIRAALVETSRLYSAPNGQNEWGYGFFDMAPSTSGEAFSIDANSTEEFSFEFPWDNAVYDVDNLHVTVWIQNEGTREVIQAGTIEFQPGFAFAVSPDDDARLTAPETETVFHLNLMNVGQFDDTFDISIESNLPEDWPLQYSTPDGMQSGNSSMELTSNSNYDIAVHVMPTADAGLSGTFTMHIASQGEPSFSWEQTFYVMTSSQILVVNADPDGNYSDYYTNALYNATRGNPVDYSVWNCATAKMDMDELSGTDVDLLIWNNGDGAEVSEEDIAGAVDFLNNGGALWAIGSDIPFRLNGSELLTMMGAAFQDRNAQGRNNVSGYTDDPVYGDDVRFAIEGGTGANNRRQPSSLLVPSGSTGIPCLRFSTIRRAGIRNETETYKTLIFGFPFEAIDTQENRDMVMVHALVYLINYDWNSVSHSPVNVPVEFGLAQNHPNPFNPETNIQFSLAKNAHVTLTVFDVLGREITRLADGSFNAGVHSVIWSGESVSSGVYFYKIDARYGDTSFQSTRKMVLMK
jgi:thiol-disulfide isomerase/thioredoxin